VNSRYPNPDTKDHSVQRNNHRLEAWVYASIQERTRARGFNYEEIGRIAFQEDNNSYWRLDQVDPDIQWTLVGFLEAYASIYSADSSTEQEVRTGATYTKMTTFDNDGFSANCTPSHANDEITFLHTGRYLVTGSYSISSDTANIEARGAAFLNGIEQHQCHFVRQIGTANDVGSASINGIIEVLHVGSKLDFRMRHDDAGSVNFVLVYASLNVTYVGALLPTSGAPGVS